MKKKFRILISNFKSILEFKKVLFISIIFTITYVVKKDSFYNIGSLDEYIKIIFYGPNNISENIIDLLMWSLYQFYLIYIIGDYLCKELTIRNIYNISRIGSKMNWYICIQLTLIFICLAYYLMGIMLVASYIFIMNGHIVVFNPYAILNIWLILSISNYFILTIYIIIFLVIKNHNISFLIVIILLYVSIEIGNIFKIDAFIPLNQGILSKHIILNFSFLWSYNYLTIVIIVNLFIIKYLIFKNDVLAIID